MKNLFILPLIILLFASCEKEIVEEEKCTFCKSYNGLLTGTANISGNTETISNRPVEITISKNVDGVYIIVFAFQFVTSYNTLIGVDGTLNGTNKLLIENEQ